MRNLNSTIMARVSGLALAMSAEGAVAGSDSGSPEKEKEIAEALGRFNKKDKLVALANDDQEIFAEVVGKLGENVHDWTEGVDGKIFTGLALAKSESGRMVLIPIASPEAAFSDPAVRAALYKLYVNRVVNSATEDDAQASQFITVGGNFKQKFDVDAFKFLAKPFVSFLRGQGLTGITINGLRQAFASQAFAQTQFPRTTKDQWEKIIGMAEALAKKNDKDTSIYDHWKATRDVQTADTSTLNLDFAKLQEAEDDLEEKINQANAPAENQATAQ
jgi:hypothetical protein